MSLLSPVFVCRKVAVRKLCRALSKMTEPTMSAASASRAKDIMGLTVTQNVQPDPNVRITHIIFDVDGLLLDTEKLYTIASENICAPYNKEFTWEVKRAQMGRKEVHSAQILIDMLKLPLTVDEYLALMHAQHETLFPQTEVLPGALKLVEHLYRHGYPLAIATGSHTASYKLKTQAHDKLFGMFQHVVLSGDDPEVKHGKPHPDVYEICMRRYAQPPAGPENVLVFEDALNGVLSAVAAKMHCVAVPDPREDKTHFSMAEYILTTLNDFKPEWYNLPPYDS